MEALVKALINDFVNEEGNEFYKMIYARYYRTVADSFSEVVEECCKIIIFGRKYSLNVRELYNYDCYLAAEAWGSHVDDQFGDFRDWVSRFVSDELEDFVNEFQKWLASQDDELASDVIFALMTGDVDLTEAIIDWLYDRLSNEDWDYPV